MDEPIIVKPNQYANGRGSRPTSTQILPGPLDSPTDEPPLADRETADLGLFGYELALNITDKPQSDDTAIKRRRIYPAESSKGAKDEPGSSTSPRRNSFDFVVERLMRLEAKSEMNKMPNHIDDDEGYAVEL